MALVSQIDQDLTTSMKEGVADRTALLRLLKSSLKNEQIKLGHELSEAEALKVVQREAKQRKDSIAQYRQGERSDLADAEQGELTLIETYLPSQMSEAELTKLVDQVIADTNASGGSQMGVVIGEVLKRAAGQADGAMVSHLVRQKLT